MLYIFKLSITTGVFPDKFETACIVPVFKSGNRLHTDNYRPIALLNTFSKIFEYCMYKRLLTYFGDNSLFTLHQYGFLPGLGTDIALNRHITIIKKSIDDGGVTAVVYVDLRKAIDLVDHKILLNKFLSYGFDGKILQWFQSYLVNRKKNGKIGNSISDIGDVKCDIPLGGVLGPLLFVIFINDLLELPFYSPIFAYDDDTSFVCSAVNSSILNKLLNYDMEVLFEWVIKNRLIINSAKTKCIYFFYKFNTMSQNKDKMKIYCHRHQCLYKCTCLPLEFVENIRYLGLTVDFF